VAVNEWSGRENFFRVREILIGCLGGHRGGAQCCKCEESESSSHL
jgi:hypothetical protein